MGRGFFLCCIIAVSGFVFGGVHTAKAEDLAPAGRLVSVCYSPELDLYVTAGKGDGGRVVLFTSGDARTWVQSPFSVSEDRFAELTASEYILAPKAVLWNPQQGRFVLNVMGRIYESADGFQWDGPETALDAGGGELLLYSLVWDGRCYWGTAAPNGSLVRSADGSALRWTRMETGAADDFPYTDVSAAGEGVVIASGGQEKDGFWLTRDSGQTWVKAAQTGDMPGMVLGSAFSEAMNRAVFVGYNGTGTGLTARTPGAAGVLSPVTGEAEEGGKIKLAKLGSAAAAVSPASPAAAAVNAGGTELVSAFLDGKLFRVLMKDDSGLPDPKKILTAAEWNQVYPASASEALRCSCSDIVSGRDGFAVVGGAPAHLSDMSDPAGEAAFLPYGPESAYEKAVFWPADSTLSPASLRIVGSDTIELTAEGSSQSYQAKVRDQSGAVIEDSALNVHWSIVGNPTGVHFDAGKLSVLPDAVPGTFILRAEAEDGGLNAEKEVRITYKPVPTGISITKGNLRIVRPAAGSQFIQYAAEIHDQYGAAMEEPVAWTVSTGPDSARIDSAGLLEVKAGIQEREILLTARAVSKPDVLIQRKLELLELEPGLYATALSSNESNGLPGAFIAEARVLNTSSVPCTAVLILAFYEGDRLALITSSEETVIPPDGLERPLCATLQLPAGQSGGGFRKRAFIWTSIGEAIPIEQV